MSSEPNQAGRRIELLSAAERGWWLRTRRPDDAVRVMFCCEAESSDPCEQESPYMRGPFRSSFLGVKGRMASVQVMLEGVIGGYIVDIDTADGESRAIRAEAAGLERAVGTDTTGFFIVSSTQFTSDED